MCKVAGKRSYRSEGSCMIVIRMEGKYGVCAPYPCQGSHYHMTSDARTVKRFYENRRKQNG